MKYNQFLRTFKMNFDELLNLSLNEELFPLCRHPSIKDDIFQLLPEDNNTPYYWDDSSVKPSEELRNYLDCLELPITEPSSSVGIEEEKLLSFPEKKLTEDGKSLGKEKKGKKVENSPFHNYQKHLNNALKKLVIVPNLTSADEEFKIAARDIWRAYVEGEIKTKKILHFVFNEKNEHSVTEAELKVYGLLDVYHSYDIQVIAQAKNYLSKLASDQINEENIQNYIKSRKMKKTEGFKEYILNFKKELEGGFIKRRVHFE